MTAACLSEIVSHFIAINIYMGKNPLEVDGMLEGNGASTCVR